MIPLHSRCPSVKNNQNDKRNHLKDVPPRRHRVTSAELDHEATKILKTNLMKANVTRLRKEGDVYVSGNCFPSYHLFLASNERKIQNKQFSKNRCAKIFNTNRNSTAWEIRNNLGGRHSDESLNLDSQENEEIALNESNGRSFLTEFTGNENVDIQTTSQSSEEWLQEQDFQNDEKLTENTCDDDSLAEAKERTKSPDSFVEPEEKTGQEERNTEEINKDPNKPGHIVKERLPNISSKTLVTLEKFSDPKLKESLQKILGTDMGEAASPDEELKAEDKQSAFFNEKDIFQINDEKLLPFRPADNPHRFHGFTTARKRNQKQLTVFRSSLNHGVISFMKTSGKSEKRRSNETVRMLSIDPEYAVKGLIGQWLKTRSGNEVKVLQDKVSDKMERQERFQEMKLLKIRLSMRLLAATA